MRRQGWVGNGVAVLLSAAALGGCTSDSTDDPDQPERACGLIKPSLVKQATGGKTFTNAGSLGENVDDRYDLLAIGQEDDGSAREKFDCTVTDRSSHAYLQVDGRSTVDEQDRDKMLATFTSLATGDGCEERQESPRGYICTEGSVTTAGFMFADRWVRVTAEAKPSTDATIDPDLLVTIAEDIHKHLG